jgi:dipeptidyl aminopeptidase/acylaminoacyl peptidase
MPSQAAPYGAWQSSITAAAVAAGEVPLGGPAFDGEDVYWLEGKPLEGGRYVVMRYANGQRTELTPAPFNARTRVHEYGGGAYLVDRGTVFFSNFRDQRLYRQDPGSQPRPITPEPDVPAGLRFADLRVCRDASWLVGVQERHPPDGSEAMNELVVLPADGSAPPRVIVSGHDFVSTARVSPDGRKLCWLAWDHPRMPWDGTELWVADFGSDSAVSNAQCVAGGLTESIFQPEWSPSGVLHFVSDRTGWWNLYRLDSNDNITALAPMDAEFGVPQWVFGQSRYTFLPDGTIATVYSRHGFDHLAVIRPGQALQILDVPYTVMSGLHARDDQLLFDAASPTEAPSIVRMTLSTGAREVLGSSMSEAIDSAYFSNPRSIAFPTDDGRATAYALYYPPANPDFEGVAGERPPLVVASHGGPTANTQAELSLGIQFWTSRGFGFVDVNYGGSTGYGREYRERLRGKWGIVDVEDCINAARYLAQQGEVDGQHLAIRGGSAGGYTTLCALVFHGDFAAGASYYGVADCEALARDTHKFESRYLDGLIGPYPQARDVYRARSPLYFADQLSCPVILFQGLEDRVVPPEQAERMAAALRAKGLPYAYLAFEGEQHGFRKAENIQRSLEAELYFYSRVFRFPLADTIEPVPIENLP